MIWHWPPGLYTLRHYRRDWLCLFAGIARQGSITELLSKPIRKASR